MTNTTIPLADLVAQGWDVSGDPPAMPFVVLDNEDGDVGPCFDFSPDELDDLIAILAALKDAPIDVQDAQEGD